LKRFETLCAHEQIDEWYSYHAVPVYRSGEAIVSCKIVSPRSFARIDLSERVIHGSVFGIAVRNEQMDIRLLLLYLNSQHFWRQLDATMPPMGIGRRTIRMSILKKLLIPKSIAYPTADGICKAHDLEKRICQVIGKGKIKKTKMAFAELDSFIDGCIAK
jgi:hypothetical protein